MTEATYFRNRYRADPSFRARRAMYARRDRARNKQRRDEQVRAWRAANPEAVAASRRRWKVAHRQDIRVGDRLERAAIDGSETVPVFTRTPWLRALLERRHGRATGWTCARCAGSIVRRWGEICCVQCGRKVALQAPDMPVAVRMMAAVASSWAVGFVLYLI